MGHIFISYSRHDLEVVDCLVGKIENAGMKVWIDRDDIKAGKTWRAQIVQAIDTCDAFVLMLSSHSAVSDNVRKEIDLAQDSGRTVFILRLDSVIKLPAEMRYQLVGLQYIDAEKLGVDDGANQLIATLREYLAALTTAGETSVRQAELVIQGVDPSRFGPEKQEQLIDFVAGLTHTPESQLQITKLTVGSLHVFVEMPAPAAFELKTRALNRDQQFKKLHIKSLRLVGNRKYVNISLGILTTTATIGFLKSLWLSLPPLFPSIVGITGGKVLVITSAVVVITAVSLAVSERVNTLPIPIPTPTQTSSPTLTPSYTTNATKTFTPKPTSTRTLTPTPTLTPTNPPPLSAPEPISPEAHQVYYFFVKDGCTNVTFIWRPVSEADVTYTLNWQTNTGSNVASFVGIRGITTSINFCAGNYQWKVRATRVSNGQIGPWSPWIPFKVKKWHIPTMPTSTPHCVHC
jgi:hypothetical protein